MDSDILPLTIVRPDEQAYFIKENQRFFETLPNLQAAVNIAFARASTSFSADGDKLVFALGYLCANDFAEILLLCGNGYGLGAMKILRGMYENAVNARYLHQGLSNFR